MLVLLTLLLVYIGDIASLSFLDFLRRHLRPYVGATAFTDGERQNPMLENDVAHIISGETNLDVEEEEALFRSYSEAVRCLPFLIQHALTFSRLAVFCTSSLQTTLTSSWSWELTRSGKILLPTTWRWQ